MLSLTAALLGLLSLERPKVTRLHLPSMFYLQPTSRSCEFVKRSQLSCEPDSPNCSAWEAQHTKQVPGLFQQWAFIYLSSGFCSQAGSHLYFWCTTFWIFFSRFKIGRFFVRWLALDRASSHAVYCRWKASTMVLDIFVSWLQLIWSLFRKFYFDSNKRKWDFNKVVWRQIMKFLFWEQITPEISGRLKIFGVCNNV